MTKKSPIYNYMPSDAISARDGKATAIKEKRAAEKNLIEAMTEEKKIDVK